MAEGSESNDALHQHDAATTVAEADAISPATPVIDAGVALTGDSIKVAEPREAPTRAERLGQREWTRSSLAFAFVIIFALIIVFVGSKVGTRDWAETKELLQILLPAETALLGSALGFYFGAKSNER